MVFHPDDPRLKAYERLGYAIRKYEAKPMNIIEQTPMGLAQELVVYGGQGEFNTIQECAPLEALAKHYIALAESHERLLEAVKDADERLMRHGSEGYASDEAHGILTKAIEQAEKLSQ
jgi:hypothetical protein